MEYQHGGDIYSQPVAIDYSANINPLGLPEGVKEALRQSLETCLWTAYPDSQCRSLRTALSRFHDLPPQWISCGNGAADLIFALIHGLKPEKGLVLAPTFLEYEQAMRSAGCQVLYHSLTKEQGFRPDVSSLIRELEEGERICHILFLCNPNNPTGISVPREDIGLLAEICCRKGILLAVDECFCDFLEESEKASVIPLLNRYPNLLVLKAFTKLYAMAGLRLGYCLCSDPGLHEAMAGVRQPWSVSGPAQRAGEAALGESIYVEQTKCLLRDQRPALKRELESLGFRVYPSEANYLFFQDSLHRPGWLYEALLARRVLIRSCANYPGLDGSFYRICIKTRQENEAFIRELTQVLHTARPQSV